LVTGCLDDFRGGGTLAEDDGRENLLEEVKVWVLKAGVSQDPVNSWDGNPRELGRPGTSRRRGASSLPTTTASPSAPGRRAAAGGPPSRSTSVASRPLRLHLDYTREGQLPSLSGWCPGVSGITRWA
jgi:hypothetical protein